jgi:hypothetical protein
MSVNLKFGIIQLGLLLLYFIITGYLLETVGDDWGRPGTVTWRSLPSIPSVPALPQNVGTVSVLPWDGRDGRFHWTCRYGRTAAEAKVHIYADGIQLVMTSLKRIYDALRDSCKYMSIKTHDT